MPINSGLATNLGGNIKFKSHGYTFNDLQGTSGAGAKTFSLAALGIGSVTLYIRIKHSVAFAGGTLSAMKVRVGKSGGATNFFAGDFDVFQAPADGTLMEVWNPSMGQLSAVTPTVTFTPTGDNCSAATAGVVNIDFVWLPVTTAPYLGLYGSTPAVL